MNITLTIGFLLLVILAGFGWLVLTSGLNTNHQDDDDWMDRHG